MLIRILTKQIVFLSIKWDNNNSLTAMRLQEQSCLLLPGVIDLAESETN
jgi:hypothetical protein